MASKAVRLDTMKGRMFSRPTYSTLSMSLLVDENWSKLTRFLLDPAVLSNRESHRGTGASSSVSHLWG